MTLWHWFYLLWLGAGALDFWLHRRSCIERTSGVRESALHLAQLAILGLGVVLWLLLPQSTGLCVGLTILVVVHAVVGYWDTRVAFPRRTITPLEQHVHSIMDIAPWVALAATCWPMLSGTGLEPVPAPRPLSTWMFALLPAFLLGVVPALFELLRCLKSARLQREPG